MAHTLHLDLTSYKTLLGRQCNQRVPATILAGLDIKIGCVEKGERDNIHVVHCSQGHDKLNNCKQSFQVRNLVPGIQPTQFILLCSIRIIVDKFPG